MTCVCTSWHCAWLHLCECAYAAIRAGHNAPPKAETVARSVGLRAVGSTVGALLGVIVGGTDGHAVGVGVGSGVGTADGVGVGSAVGASVVIPGGMKNVGAPVGQTGTNVGLGEGTAVGRNVGVADGCTEGRAEGEGEGLLVGGCNVHQHRCCRLGPFPTLAVATNQSY